VLLQFSVLGTLFSDLCVFKAMRPGSAGVQTSMGKYKKGDGVKIEVKDEMRDR
jgi:hypothetical protein